MGIWSFTVAASRLPVAMAPLAFVFLARETTGGYALGAMMAAAYTTAEAVGAPLLGIRLRSRSFRREIAAGLLVSAVFFAALALVPDASSPVAVTMAAAAGAAGAAGPGALRAMVADLVPGRHLHSALSWESSLNMSVWAASPALVAASAVHWSATVPFFVAAAATTVGAVCVLLLPEKTGRPEPDSPTRGTARQLASAWRIYLTSAAAMYLLATVELALPALLEQRNEPVGYSGPMLTGFALASILAGLLYGLRTWPGSPELHSTLLLYGTIAAAGAFAVVPVLGAMAGLLAAAGVCQAIVLIARNLSLQQSLPTDLHPVGYSLQYAGSGIGYGASAAVTGLLLTHTQPSGTVLITAAVTLALATATLTGRTRSAVGGPDGVGDDHQLTGKPASQPSNAPGPSSP
ncbi:hypothetical protein GCM10012280_68780 [Wenjunlia tyrosinilytica]|uniref:MFS transporter n=2 Tax=Wenjunlia tyrosinilytica TaxID=1544741 RepID=A0A918A0S6_9ACTN|nr:hypothetical protein GCM10012280_68780 [Wenjunlia tyrosinilytica]